MYIANRRTRQIHREGCAWSKLITRNNEQTFPKLEPALAEGYDGCRYCLGQFDGYKREKGTRRPGKQVAEKLGYAEDDLAKAYVTYQEGVNPTGTPAIALRSLFPFTDENLKDTDGEVEGSGENLQFLEKVGTEKGVYDFSADKAVMRLPVNCEVKDGFFFTIRFMLPSGKKKAPDNKKILLLRGPMQVPVRVYLHTAGGKFTVSMSLKTTMGEMVCKGDGYSFTEDAWHTLTGIYTPKELDLIADGKQCVARRVMPENTPDAEQPNSFAIGYDPEDKALQYRGYVSSFEYDSGVKQADENLVEKAAAAGLGEIDSWYEDLEDKEKASLGKPVKEGSANYGGLYREYENGTVYWSRVTKTALVTGFFLIMYNRYGGPNGALGYPWGNAKNGMIQGVTYQVFQKGLIYHQVSDGASWGGGCSGKVLDKYFALGAEKRGLGVPNPVGCDLKDMLHPFDEKLTDGFYRMPVVYIDSKGHYQYSWIYYSDDTEPVLIPYGPLERYYTRDKIKQFGYPLSDPLQLHKYNDGRKDWCMVFQNGELFWQEAPDNDYPINPVFLTGDFLKAYHDFDGYKKQGMPLHFFESRNYCDCEKGTLVRSGGKVRFIDEIEFNLSEAIACSIDDGIEFIGKDTTPELSYYLTLRAENDRVKSNAQLVNIQSEYSRSKTSKKRTFPAACKFRMKIRGSSTIFFHIKYVDWDAASKNDYLGSVERTLNVDNLWMLDDKLIQPGYPLEGIYVLPLDHYGSDAKKNKYNTVKTSFTVRQTDGEQYVLNPDLFRTNAWWAFENFSNSRVLSRNFVASVFKDMDYTQSTWDTIRHPLDSAFYAAAKYAGTQGNCFGMCLGAVEAFYGRCAFSMPVSKYKANDRNALHPSGSDDVNSPLREYLQAGQLRQFSVASIRHIVRQIVRRKVENPVAVFKDVEKEIEKNKFSLITMLNLAEGFKGHVVLAYAAYRLGESLWRIIVADPNYCSRRVVDNPNDPQHPYPDINWIDIDPKKNTFQYVIPDPNKKGTFAYDPVYRTSAKKLGCLLYSTSYWTVAGEPTTPSWYLVGLTLGMLTGLSALGPVTGGLTILLILGLIGSADCVEVECDGKKATLENDGLIPLLPAGGSDSNCQLFLVTKPADSYSVRMNGQTSGQVKQILETARGIYTVETEIKKGETATVSVNQAKELLPELTVSGIKSRQITMEIREKAAGVRKETAEKLRMKADSTGKAVLKLDKLTGGTRILGAAKGAFTLTKQIRRNNGDIDAAKLNLTAKAENEEIRVIRARDLSLRNVMVERVDKASSKVKAREKMSFKEE